MKRILLTLLCLLLLPLPIAATPLSDVIRALESPFQGGSATELRITDYSAEFFQESKIVALDRSQRARGRVEVAFDYRPQMVPEVRFRWQYEQPTTQQIVSDGKTLWVYLPENNQVIQSDIELVSQARENNPMTFLTGLGNLSRDFVITWGTPNRDVEGNFILNLTPRRVSQLISRMTIVVDRHAVEALQQRQKGNDPLAPPAPALPVPSSAPKFPASGGFPFSGYSGTEGVWFPILSTTVADPNGNTTVIEFSDVRVNLGQSALAFDFMIPAGVEVVRPSGQGMGY